jgi:hypothetical protein
VMGLKSQTEYSKRKNIGGKKWWNYLNYQREILNL